MTEVLVSLFGFLGTIVASYYAYAAHREGKRSKASIDEINDAVNHRHSTGTPRLYDMVLSNFQRVDRLEKRVAAVQRNVSQLAGEVHDHQVQRNETQDLSD